VALFAAYAFAEGFYNKLHGPPPARNISYHDEQNYEQRELEGKADVESGKAALPAAPAAVEDGDVAAHDQAASSR
jgi:hypothetical protein